MKESGTVARVLVGAVFILAMDLVAWLGLGACKRSCLAKSVANILRTSRSAAVELNKNCFDRMSRSIISYKRYI